MRGVLQTILVRAVTGHLLLEGHFELYTNLAPARGHMFFVTNMCSIDRSPVLTVVEPAHGQYKVIVTCQRVKSTTIIRRR